MRAPSRNAELRSRNRTLPYIEPPVPMYRRRKIAGRSALVVLVILAMITGSLAGLTIVYSVDLPQIGQLEQFRPSTTTDLYDRNGHLFGSFALEHRVVVDYNGFSPILRQAIISIEDKNFESHWGVNVFRIAGAVIHDMRTHGRTQGASTLTMQLARDLFLSSDRTWPRKVQEAFLAIQIERSFTKQQIFTLYGNQIYLGSGQYGFEAASQFYFSKHATELTLTEAALLAGLPKGPSAYSPIFNPDKAMRRRNLVLSEMESDGIITHVQAQEARSAPLGLHIAEQQGAIAPWFQEEVRQELDKRFGSEQVHEAGLRVDTTLDLDLQKVANRAVVEGVATYERRRAWHGHLENVLESGTSLQEYRHPDWATASAPGDYVHAVVTRVLPLEIDARIGPPDQKDSSMVLTPADWQWTGQRSATALVKQGDIIYLHLASNADVSAHRATLEQDSGAQGALMAIDNVSGDVLAMVGGRDFAVSQFNRAIQAQRQTGSSFKPYVYTAAIEDGVKPDDTIVDAPVSFGSYAPHNYENDFKGRMTIASAFAESRNVPAVKLAARVGIRKVIEVAHRFGVTSNIPAYLPVALGAVEITLDEQVASYSVFPNDGVRVTPHLVRKVSNADGITLWEDRPEVSQVIDQQTARTMMTLLKGVTQRGTGAAAAQLNHPIGGKTGTTSDFTDAWFLGFSPTVTCGVWIGFDSRESLGEKETGARAALPIWMTFMRAAIADKPDEQFLGDDESDQMLKAQAAPPANTPPVRQAAPKPPLITSAQTTSGPVGPAKATVGTGTTPVARLTEATEASPRVKPALEAEPAAVKSRAVVKPALDSPR